jgi:hypothetical protein
LRRQFTAPAAGDGGDQPELDAEEPAVGRADERGDPGRDRLGGVGLREAQPGVARAARHGDRRAGQRHAREGGELRRHEGGRWTAPRSPRDRGGAARGARLGEGEPRDGQGREGAQPGGDADHVGDGRDEGERRGVLVGGGVAEAGLRAGGGEGRAGGERVGAGARPRRRCRAAPRARRRSTRPRPRRRRPVWAVQKCPQRVSPITAASIPSPPPSVPTWSQSCHAAATTPAAPPSAPAAATARRARANAGR